MKWIHVVRRPWPTLISVNGFIHLSGLFSDAVSVYWLSEWLEITVGISQSNFNDTNFGENFNNAIFWISMSSHFGGKFLKFRLKVPWLYELLWKILRIATRNSPNYGGNEALRLYEILTTFQNSSGSFPSFQRFTVDKKSDRLFRCVENVFPEMVEKITFLSDRNMQLRSNIISNRVLCRKFLGLFSQEIGLLFLSKTAYLALKNVRSC